MPPFEFFLILLTIILGLILTNVLSDLIRAVKSTTGGDLFWLPVAWCALLVVGLLQWWWALWTQQSTFNKGTFKHFYQLVLIFTALVFLFCSASFLLPSGHEGLLRSTYFKYHQPFGWFGAAAMIVFSLCDGFLLTQHRANLHVFRGISAISLAVCALTRNECAHWAAVVVNIGVIAFFVTYEAPSLRDE